jgi:NADH:ubiquinone oxidoreductase subunit F (NADH-binding)
MNDLAGSGPLLGGNPVTTLSQFVARGGGSGLAAARELGPTLAIRELRLSGLRGRGGAGFPTAKKWASIRSAAEATDRTYAVCNAAEGEPGTFKDRAVFRHNPYQVIEGLAIAAYCVGATAAYLAIKKSFHREIAVVSRALAEMTAAGLAGDVPITIVTGPDSYLFGEEKGLLEVIEGEDPLPRRFPPYLHGLFATGPQMGWSAHASSGGASSGGASSGGASASAASSDGGRAAANPTLVNNVETLASAAHILARGPEWYRSLGTSSSPGTMVFTVVGDVVRPGYGELELGLPLREVIARIGGGPLPGRTIKAVFSGVSNAVITGADLDAPASYEGLSAIGSGLGAAGFIVYDDTADMVAVARMWSRFLYVESCGQCSACKLNSGEITLRLSRLEEGLASISDVNEIGGLLAQVTDQNRCFLPEEEQTIVSSIMRAFPEEFVEHLDHQVVARRQYTVPKIVDLGDGRVVYDKRIMLKQPDWTYQTVRSLAG